MTPFPGNEAISAWKANRMITLKFMSRKKSGHGRKGNKLPAELQICSRAHDKMPFLSMLCYRDRGVLSSGVCHNTGRYILPGIEAISAWKANRMITLKIMSRK